jgi:serine/threonine protein kinase
MGLHVLDGLLFLQANRIAHCDVKEDNVLVDACGCCYIADLGEAIELVRAQARRLYLCVCATLAASPACFPAVFRRCDVLVYAWLRVRVRCCHSIAGVSIARVLSAASQ